MTGSFASMPEPCQSAMQGRDARVLELEGSLAMLEAQQASMEEAAESQHAEVRSIRMILRCET